MILLSHELVHYRNIAALDFRPSRGVNVVTGNNGQGKTNLLESIFLLTGARSFRGGKDNALIQMDQAFAMINTEFFSEGRNQSLQMRITEKGRTASLNRGNEVKASQLVGKVCCVVFSPEHLELVKGSPELRRRFLDTALCQISPTYLGALKRYTRLLNQRNALLKEAQYVSAAHEMLDVYDAQFVEAACLMTRLRFAFVDEMLPLAERNYDTISGHSEALSFSYKSTLFESESTEYEEGLMTLAAARAADLRAGFSTVGPHRDDLVLLLDGADTRLYASQGQQRCIVLALKLAEVELMEIRIGERPILLLDDVLSELDPARQDYLIESLSDAQAIITCCTPELITERTDAQIFVMESGELGG